MAISVQNLLKERKYPFIFSLFLLLILVSLFLFTNSQSHIYFSTDLKESQPKLIASNPSTGPRIPVTFAPSTVDSSFLDLKWNVCEGFVAVDYIPCLDNTKAIKALPSRRHMEHRERHCPKPTPRCLVPLPQGYKVPVPWPKSRDMVRYFGKI